MIVPWLLAFSLASAATPSADRLLAESFVRMIAKGEWQPLGESRSLEQWSGARETFERYTCVEVRSWKVTASSSDAITLALDADGIVVNSARERKPFPRIWYLARGSSPGEIAGAATESQRLIERLMSAPGDDAARAATSQLLRDAAYALAISTRTGGCSFHRESCRGAAEILAAEAERRSVPDAAAFALIALSMTHRDMPDKALPAARAAREWAHASGNLDAIALADANAWRFEPDAGWQQQLLAGALELTDVLDDPRPVLQVLREHAGQLFIRFEVREAFSATEDLLARSERVDWERGRMMALLDRARCMGVSGDMEMARHFSMDAATRAAALGDGDVQARALNTYGSTRLFEGRWADAYPVFRRALDIAPGYSEETIGILRTNLASGLLDTGKADEAAAHVDALLANERVLERSLYRSATLILAATVREAQGRHREAIELTRRATSTKEAAVWTVWRAKAHMARLLVDCGDLDPAIEQLHDAVDLLEERFVRSTVSHYERAANLNLALGVFVRLIDALVRAGRAEEALLVAERMRARIAEETLNGAEEPVIGPVDAERRNALHARINALNRERAAAETAEVSGDLQEARSELERFETEMALRYPSTRQMMPVDGLFDGRLGADTVAIEFVVSEKNTLAFRLDRDGVTAVVIPAGLAELAKAVESLTDAVDSRSFLYRKAARDLYRLLLEPLGLDEGPQPLCIVADGPLWKLPFHVLIAPDGRALIQQRPVFYASALTVAANRGVRRGPRTLGIFGNPTGSMESLDHAEQEVNRIAAIYGARRSDVYVGPHALESVFKKVAQRYDVIHLATHGLLDDHAPMYSAVMLAPNAADDGLLEAREVRELPINAEVAVLAGCDTASGKVHRGEGIIGLAWAFMAAGCPTMVVSQWNAESAATEALMVEFHRHLARGDSPAVALQKAQVKLMQDARYADPFYWAPFVVVGAGG